MNESPGQLIWHLFPIVSDNHFRKICDNHFRKSATTISERPRQSFLHSTPYWVRHEKRCSLSHFELSVPKSQRTKSNIARTKSSASFVIFDPSVRDCVWTKSWNGLKQVRKLDNKSLIQFFFCVSLRLFRPLWFICSFVWIVCPF